MSNHTPSPEAVEAACKASYGEFQWDEMSEQRRTVGRQMMKAAISAAAPFIRAETVKEIVSWLPAELRFWDKKQEFFGLNHNVPYEEREASALAVLMQTGDVTEIIINEGDWLALPCAVRKIRALAFSPSSEGEKS